MTDPDLTMSELDEIERLSEQATQGPWMHDRVCVVLAPDGECVCDTYRYETAAYLAALSPSRVRALVRMARVALPKPDCRAECPMQNGSQCCNDPGACLAAIRERIGALATMDDPDEMIACISDIEELVREEPHS